MGRLMWTTCPFRTRTVTARLLTPSSAQGIKNEFINWRNDPQASGCLDPGLAFTPTCTFIRRQGKPHSLGVVHLDHYSGIRGIHISRVLQALRVYIPKNGGCVLVSTFFLPLTLPMRRVRTACFLSMCHPASLPWQPSSDIMSPTHSNWLMCNLSCVSLGHFSVKAKLQNVFSCFCP